MTHSWVGREEGVGPGKSLLLGVNMIKNILNKIVKDLIKEKNNS